MSFLDWWKNFWNQSEDEDEYDESNLNETMEIYSEDRVESDSITHEPGLIEWFFGWGDRSNGEKD